MWCYAVFAIDLKKHNCLAAGISMFDEPILIFTSCIFFSFKIMHIVDYFGKMTSKKTIGDPVFFFLSTTLILFLSDGDDYDLFQSLLHE